MYEKKGEFLERLVQIIEQSISPESVVEHNIQLPILNSRTGETAQCDIVIRTGKKPRETITIIEVQNSKRAVEINEFRGWVAKLAAVGAQHLYCVSRKDFAKSIKEQVALSGNTVKLITLKEIDTEEIPINFFKFSTLYHDIDIPSIKRKETIISAEEAITLGTSLERIEADIKKLETNDRKFSLDRILLMALSTFCIEDVIPSEGIASGTRTIALGYDEDKLLYYFLDGLFVSIKLRLEYTWTFKKVDIPVSVLSYDQDDHGALAWVLESHYQSSRGPISIRIPVTKNGDAFSISGMFFSAPVDTHLSFSLEKNPDSSGP